MINTWIILCQITAATGVWKLMEYFGAREFCQMFPDVGKPGVRLYAIFHYC